MDIKLSNDNKKIIFDNNIIYTNDIEMTHFYTYWENIIIIIESDERIFKKEKKPPLFCIDYEGNKIWQMEFINYYNIEFAKKIKGMHSELSLQEIVEDYDFRFNSWLSITKENNIMLAKNWSWMEVPIDPYTGKILLDLNKLDEYNRKKGGAERFK